MSIEQVEELQLSLQVDTVGIPLTADHKKLLSNEVVKMTESSNQSSKMDLNEAIKKFLSYAINVKDAALTSLLTTDNNVYYVTYNGFNEFYIGLVDNAEYYVISLGDLISKCNIIILIITISAGVWVIICLILLILTLVEIQKQREFLLTLFLDIREGHVKSLLARTEIFIGKQQTGEFDVGYDNADDKEDEIQLNAMDEDNEHSGENKLRKKRKKFKNNNSGNKLILPTLIMISILVITYFLANFYTASKRLQDTKQFEKEVNITASFESWLYFVFNAQRQLYVDNGFVILGSATPFNTVKANVKTSYELDSNLSDEHSKNLSIHSAAFKEIFNTILMSKPCEKYPSVQAADPIETADSIIYPLSKANCDLFMDAQLKNGLAIALGLHYNNIRYMINMYQTYNGNLSAVFNKDMVTGAVCPT